MRVKLSSVLRQFSPDGRARRQYRSRIHDGFLNDSMIVIEAQQGRSLNGNMFYLIQYLESDIRFSRFRLIIPVRTESWDAFSKQIAEYEFKHCELVRMHSAEYVDALATAKYLFTDTAFPPYYVKKAGQVVLNTWHGTPLKAMGRSDSGGLHSLGNIQRNFSFSDYLLFPSYYMAQHIFDDYMLHGICNAKVLFCGYPRNSILLSTPDPSRLVSKYLNREFDGKKLYAYMPTWRPLRKGLTREHAGIEMTSILLQMDARLCDDELMFVSLHPMQKASVDFSLFRHIESFPDEIETYETLSQCDVLITDYSSVMFDYASSGKDIVLFEYDCDLYLKDRGMYVSFDELPFLHVQTMQDLFAALRTPGCSRAPEGFLEEFCSFERIDAAEKVCEAVLFGDNTLPHDLMPKDNRKNILIYGGNLAQNGITASLMNFVGSVDSAKYHLFVTFDTRKVAANKEMISRLPEDVSYIPCMGKNNMTFLEKAIQYLYYKKKISFGVFDRHLRDAYAASRERQYGNLPFHAVVQFSGYDFKKIYQFSLFDCRRIIFVHNDMVREATEKKNQRLDMLKYAYETYDHVAVVSEDILPITESIAPNATGYCVVNNMFDPSIVRLKSQLPIVFDPDTKSSTSLDALHAFLKREGKLIVSIGRYSPEKQHRLLIEAFNKEWMLDQTLKLIIIGGNTFADLYSATVEYAASLPCADSVVCIRKMSNPYPILRMADGFILPSKYEGFGLVLLEADALGIPVAATDIPGPRGLLQSNGGLLLNNSLEGVSHGIRMLNTGTVPRMNIDFDKYNHCALEALYRLLE